MAIDAEVPAPLHNTRPLETVGQAILSQSSISFTPAYMSPLSMNIRCRQSWAWLGARTGIIWVIMVFTSLQSMKVSALPAGSTELVELASDSRTYSAIVAHGQRPRWEWGQLPTTGNEVEKLTSFCKRSPISSPSMFIL